MDSLQIKKKLKINKNLYNKKNYKGLKTLAKIEIILLNTTRIFSSLVLYTMNKLIIRLGFIILIGLLLVTYVFPWDKYGINMPFTQKEYKLWLDLQWGVELDYKVDLDEAKKEEDYSPQKEKQILEWLKSIIDKRIQALKINDSVITTASYVWEQHIIVQIPLKWKNPEEDKLNIARAKDAIWKVMKIIFKERRVSVDEKDKELRKKIATKALEELQKSKYSFSVTAAKTKDNYPDVEIGTLELSPDEIKAYFTFDNKNKKLGLFSSVIDGKWIWNLVWEDWKWIINIKNISGENVSFDYIFIAAKPSDWIPAKGMGADWKTHVLNERYFVNSSVQFNEVFEPMIELTFNSEWAKIFWDLSTRLVNKQMAIFVWGELLTAPNINEPILSWKAVITGNYSSDEAKELVSNINTGVVPAPIYLTSEKAIDSKLGSDSLTKLIIAGAIWFLLIFIFLISVYKVSWLLASVALLMYIAIILFIVKVLGITLTLASIAGLILSVGMAIDANILIFERIRDEIRKWEKLSKAAKIGFKKSWSAIWDSNVTGLIVAIILFIFGINLIKGFGLMLAIGILVSLFSVMWISRVLVFLASKKFKNAQIFIWKKSTK